MWDDIKRAITVRKYFPQKSEIPSSIERLLGKTPVDFRYSYIPEKNVSVDLDKPFGSGFIPGPEQEVMGYGGPQVQGITSGYGLPQQARDFYSNYSFNGRGQFKYPFDTDYAEILWSAIDEMYPDESYNNKIALFETMGAVAHAESHSGYNAGGNPNRVSNIWNMGYNASPSSPLKYDPEDRNEMARFALERMVNKFGVLENKGLTDQMIHNYHIGPNAPYDQAGVDKYRSFMGGWESQYKPTYPWE